MAAGYTRIPPARFSPFTALSVLEGSQTGGTSNFGTALVNRGTTQRDRAGVAHEVRR